MINNIFYQLKPFIPRRVQLFLRRRIASWKRRIYSKTWPIDKSCGKPPEGWKGWPGGKRFALILTHDVETQKGHDKCRQLMKLEESLGLRSSFNFVPKRYNVSHELRHHLTNKGFEVGVHGLHHDGKYFQSRELFQERAMKINLFLKEWEAVGFRSPSMQRNLEWFHDLNIEYDSSTFDTDPFEPQSDGVGTIFPFVIKNKLASNNKYIELPYTLPQDHSLFVILREKNINIWKRKLDWIVEHGGMALLITHPDYMNFGDGCIGMEEYPADCYLNFLEYIKSKYKGQYWHVLPKEMAHLWGSNVLNYNKGKKLIKSKSGDATGATRVKNKALKIWIDFDNSPHVVFFRPIIEKLRARGCKVTITAKDCFQTCDLADLFKIEYKKIGKHFGKHKFLKILGVIVRAVQLLPFVLKEKPDLALAHGSRSLILLSNLLRIPSCVIGDYEHAKGLVIFNPTWMMTPELIPKKSISHFKEEYILNYPGIKEDVYVPDFVPNPNIKHELGINEQDLIVTIRPPATKAHYHNHESEQILDAVITYLGHMPKVRMVIVPRDKDQENDVTKKWQKMCATKKILVPSKVINGLDLIWCSDLVISGGGTMNREAAALGVPVYSIFRGTMGAIDKYLASEGRLVLIESVEDVKNKIIVKRWSRPERPKQGNNTTINKVVENIMTILDR